MNCWFAEAVNPAARMVFCEYWYNRKY